MVSWLVTVYVPLLRTIPHWCLQNTHTMHFNSYQTKLHYYIRSHPFLCLAVNSSRCVQIKLELVIKFLLNEGVKLIAKTDSNTVVAVKHLNGVTF